MYWSDIKEMIVNRIFSPHIWLGILVIIAGYFWCFRMNEVSGSSGYVVGFGNVSSTADSAQISLFLIWCFIGIIHVIDGFHSDLIESRPYLAVLLSLMWLAIIALIVVVGLFVPQTSTAWKWLKGVILMPLAIGTLSGFAIIAKYRVKKGY